MQQVDIKQSHEVKRCSLFQLHRVTTAAGDRLLLKSATSEQGKRDLIQHELSMLARVVSPRVARPVGLVEVGDRPRACYADFSGTPLTPERRSAADELTQLVRELCAILDAFHGSGLLLVGLAPSSFLQDGAGRLQLIDAPFSQPSAETIAHDEVDWIRSPFLPYAAPEAIRTLSRPLDRSADLYGLGALLYELLGGRPPFASRDPAELIQSHLARQPRPLGELAPELPAALTSAVMQLLAKSPAERPPSVRDFLEACQVPPLEPNGATMPGRFRFGAHARALGGTRFHGREATMHELSSSLEESGGRSIAFIEGDPGSGKTSLLEELRKAALVTASCWGKFARRGAGQPLSGWAALAKALANAALGSGPSEFQALRKRVDEALGASGPALVALAEEWDAVLHCGSGPAEHFEGGLNRTALALQRLLGSYSDAATPMWVFLDDLQWADGSSLRILELLLTLPNCPNLRVLASVRSPEPGEDYQALDALKGALRRNGVDVSVHALGGLAPTELGAMVEDDLGGSVDGLTELLQFLAEKTRGNPFFVRELLSALIRENALVRGSGGWRWSPTSARVALPDSLLDLLVRRLHELSQGTKALLIAAACIGGGARRSDLVVATGLEPSSVREGMREAVVAGLMHELVAAAPDDDPAYAFTHDRVHEAALALASDAERVKLSIGLFRMLAAATPRADRALTFTLANLFNAGSAKVESDAERLLGAAVNQSAGVAAKAKGAYAQSLQYLEKAVDLLGALPEDARWREHRALTRAVYEQAAEAALLCNRFELNAELCGEALERSSTTLEKAPAYEFLIRGLSAQKRYGEAVELALRAQADFGIRFPRRPSIAHVIWGYVWMLRRVKKLGAARLLNLPRREDAETVAASRLMQTVFAITHFHKPELFPLFVFRQVEQCVVHGNDAFAGQAYSAFSMILAGLGETELAHEIGTMGLGLPSTPAGDKLRCRSLFAFYSFVVPWREPAQSTFAPLARAADVALEHGDFEFVGYARTMRALGRLYTGSPLAELAADFERELAQLTALGQERCVLIQSIMCEAVHELRHGVTTGPLSGPFYDRRDGLLRCKDPMDQTLVFHHHLAELCVSAHLGDQQSARGAVEAVGPFVANGAFGSYLLANFLFYEAWTVGACAASSVGALRNARRRLRNGQKQLRAWSKSAPANFDAKLDFVVAERLRLSGRHDDAARRYESAIDGSRTQGNYLEAALIHVRAASLWLERGFARLAGRHLEDAHALYVHAGALACAERLAQTYPQHLSLAPGRLDDAASPRLSESLDYHALIKASQAISGEILQPRLLERLLETVMEHTAAQRGVLLLERRGELAVVAGADVDGEQVQLIANETVETTARVCRSIVRYVARVEKPVVLADATEDATFGRDEYVKSERPRSILCTPLMYQAKLVGLIYLENNRVGHVFTVARLEMVSLLASQAAISIANARFHALQLEAQQAKISPHFLFNALSSIAELATLDGAKAETAIVKLAHLYRYILTSSGTELVSLDREIAIVRDYLTLEKLRFGSKLDFSVTHEGRLEDVRIPGLLIQPLVENSIRHAVAPKLGDGHVWVHARVDAARCNIVVQDDGDGTKHPSTGTGFGLKSVQQRLELVYGSRFSFAISQRGGYRVELEVPHDATSPPP